MSKPEDRYGLREIPKWAFYGKDYDHELWEMGHAMWSGEGGPPDIGERVHVWMNQFNWCIVQGYFIESGYLGLYLRPTRPPAWWTRQIRAIPDRHLSAFPNAAMIFGAELSWVLKRSGYYVSARPRTRKKKETT